MFNESKPKSESTHTMSSNRFNIWNFNTPAFPRRWNKVGAVMLGLLATGPQHAQSAPASNPEVDAIRKEMQDMRTDYERRMDALEQRLQQVETGAATNGVATN